MSGPAARVRAPEPALLAPDAATWLATHLAARWEARAVPGVAGRIVNLRDVLTDDRAVLERTHRRLVADGVPAPAAATYLAGWFAGGVAGAVGFGLAAGGVGFLAAPPGAPALHLHPDGWPMRVDLAPRAVVPAGHRWAGHAGIEVVDDLGSVVRRAVASLVRAVEPVIEACHGLARVGRTGLWNEVGDALGSTLAHQDVVAVTDVMVETLEAAVAAPGVPWRSRPTLWFVESAALGRVHVAQKGGCCLAYTCPADDDSDEEPAYCTTCSFRAPEDVASRQLVWRAAADAAGEATDLR